MLICMFPFFGFVVAVQMKEFVQNTKSEYPLVVLDNGSGKLEEVMGNKELTAMNGDAQKFVVEMKGYLQQHGKA